MCSFSSLTMNKFVLAFGCLLLSLIFYFQTTEAAAAVSKTYGIEARSYNSLTPDCTKQTQPAVHFRRPPPLFPQPRIGRREDPNFTRMQRVFGIVKQPRIGRSDPSLAENENRRAFGMDEDNAYLDTGYDFGQTSGISNYHKDEDLRNYLSARRRDSMAPWAFFLITPNFQNSDQNMDLLTQFGQKVDNSNDD